MIKLTGIPDPPAPPLADMKHETRASRRVPWTLVTGLAIASALLALLWLASRIVADDALAFDQAIILAMRSSTNPSMPIGPHWLPSAMRDVTALGGSVALTGIVVIATVFLILRRLWRTALLIVLATVSGAVAVTVAKAVFERARPNLIERLMEESSASFPSGHAANSAIVYLSIATLLFPIVRARSERFFLIVTMMTLVGAIGISRVYLGVHWPSDVIAGWIFGSLWALGWWSIELRWFRAAAQVRAGGKPSD